MSKLEEKVAVSKNFPPSGDYLKTEDRYVGPLHSEGDIFELKPLSPEPDKSMVVNSGDLNTPLDTLKSNISVNLRNCTVSLGDKIRFDKKLHTYKNLSVVPLNLLIQSLFSMKGSSSITEENYTQCILRLFFQITSAVSELHKAGVADLNLNENTIVIRQDGSVLLEPPESAKKLDKGGASPRTSPEEKKDISSLGNLLCFLLFLKKFEDGFSVNITCEENIREELSSNNYMDFFPIVLPLLKGGQTPNLLLQQNFWKKWLDEETTEALKKKGGNPRTVYPDAFFAALDPLMAAKQAENRAAIEASGSKEAVTLTITKSAL